MSKTGRIRGQVFRQVRNFALTHQCFTAEDLVMLPLPQAVNATNKLARAGELRRVRPGKRGRIGFVRPIYSATPKLRDRSAMVRSNYSRGPATGA